MFEVGFTELLVISVLALIVLGPEKLPKVVSELGRWMGRARAMARQFREQLEDEVTFDDPPKGGERKSGEGAGSGTTSSAGSAGSAAASGAVSSGTAATADGGNVSAETSTAGDGSPSAGDDPDTRHNDYPGALYTGADDHYSHAPIDDASPSAPGGEAQLSAGAGGVSAQDAAYDAPSGAAAEHGDEQQRQQQEERQQEQRRA